MSDEALSWMRTVAAPDPLCRAVLRELCGYADPLGVTWSPVPVLAFDLMKSERMIQRALRKLEKAALIKATGKFHHRNVPFYQLAVDRPGERANERAKIVAGVRAEAAGRRRAGPANGDMGVTVQSANGDMGATPNGDTGDTQQHRTTPEAEDKSSPSGRGRGREDLAFGEAFAAYPEKGRLGVSSRRQAAEAWASEAAGGADPLRMLAACRAYAADKGLWGSSGRPKAMHRFLAEGCWADFDGVGVAEAAARTAFADAGIRAAFVDRFGEAAAGSWLDRAGWDPEARRLSPATGAAMDWWRRSARDFATAQNITVEREGVGA